MALWEHIQGNGTFPWTNLDTTNYDWFINEFFSLANFVKTMANDNKRMKDWVIKNVKPVKVVAELVSATRISESDKQTIRDNLGIKQAEVKVKDVKVNGTSVLNEEGVATITLPPVPNIPVKGVEINGDSIVDDDGIAKIEMPKTMEEWRALVGIFAADESEVF